MQVAFAWSLCLSVGVVLISIIPSVYQYISALVLSTAISPFQLGLFFGANRIYKAFNTLYGPISQVFFPLLSSSYEKNTSNAKILYKNYLLILFILGIIFFIVNYYFSKDLVLFFLGNEFLESTKVLTLFSFVLLLTAISNAVARQWLMANNKDIYYLSIILFSSLISFLTFISLLETQGSNAFPISLIIFELISIILALLVQLKND